MAFSIHGIRQESRRHQIDSGASLAWKPADGFDVKGVWNGLARTAHMAVLAIAFFAATPCILGQDVAQVSSSPTMHAADFEDARHSIQQLHVDSPKRVSLRLEGTIVSLVAAAPQSGTIVVEVSEKSDWRETITIGGQTSTESHIRGVRSVLLPDGRKKTFALPQLDTDLLPTPIVMGHASDLRYAIVHILKKARIENKENSYTFRPKASIGSFNPSVNPITSSALDFASFEADVNEGSSAVTAIRRFYPILPDRPQYASFCQDKSGNPLSHPVLKGVRSDLDCSSFQKLLSVPTETRYSDYLPSDFGLIPRTIKRYTLGKLTASIQITGISPLQAPFSIPEEKH